MGIGPIKRNMRIILLIKDQRQAETKIALQFGIYDIIFGNFYPNQIKEIIEHPKIFKDISDLYRKTFNINVKKKRFTKNEKANSFFSRN